MAMGIIPATLLAIGIGIAMAGPAYFWYGIYSAYAALLWLAIDWWVYFHDLTVRQKSLSGAGIIIPLLIVSGIAFHPAPISISFLRMAENYTDGIDVAGIKWSGKYSGLRLFLGNDSDSQYTNIDFMIRTDVYIADIGFETKFSQCIRAPTIPNLAIGGVSIGDGKTMQPMRMTKATVYKIFCDKLLPHDQIQIVIATTQDFMSGGFSEPAAVAMRGSFDGFGRARSLDKSECLIRGCTPVLIP